MIIRVIGLSQLSSFPWISLFSSSKLRATIVCLGLSSAIVVLHTELAHIWLWESRGIPLVNFFRQTYIKLSKTYIEHECARREAFPLALHSPYRNVPNIYENI